MTKSKKWSAKAKLEIAILALKGELTINDLCQQYQVAPSQVYAWKKQLLKQGAELFEKANKSKKKKEALDHECIQKKLYEKIGQLTMERDFLKKASSTLHLNPGED